MSLLTKVNTMSSLTVVQFDKSSQDQQILETMLDLNFYASKFYQFIQQQVQVPRLKGRFGALAMVHQKILQNLKLYVAQKNFNLKAPQDSSKSLQTRFISKACAVLRGRVDQSFTNKVATAEMKCLDFMIEETKHSGASRQTKWMLAHQLNYLHNSHDYLRSLN